MSDVITTRGLRKSFRSRTGPVEAVRGVDLNVGRGEIFGFLGPNGAGKTTTLRMLTTLLPIDDGSATVAGFDVAREPHQVRSHIGYVSQLGGTDLLATGRENLVLQGKLYSTDNARVARRSAELIELLDLGEFADRKAKTYSGGQRRRLDIAMGLIHEPEVLFLDEPTTGLDPQNRANMWDQVRTLRDLGTTVFLTTHYLEEADALSDRLVIMDHGTIIVQGTPKELKQKVAGESVTIGMENAAEAERVAALLQSEAFVKGTGTEHDHIRLYVDEGSTALPAILRRLDEAGIVVRSITMSRPSLDDVFLMQTGRSLRDTAEGGAQ